MLKLRQLTAITLCLVLFSATSQAWFGFGHMAVAYLAYQKLTPGEMSRTREQIRQQYARHGSTKFFHGKNCRKTLLQVGDPR